MKITRRGFLRNAAATVGAAFIPARLVDAALDEAETEKGNDLSCVDLSMAGGPVPAATQDVQERWYSYAGPFVEFRHDGSTWFWANGIWSLIVSEDKGRERNDRS